MPKVLLAPVLFALILFSLVIPARADDGIPDNCEYSYGTYYRPDVFPRYEPQNRRLLLVDWSTGADVGVLATDLDDTLIRAWSTDCRYLAVATGNAESRATAVYDTVDLHYVGDVPGARIVAHPITWGPDDFLMVEGRKGAVLWNIPANIQYPLDVGFNTTTYRNFSRLRWDADKHEVVANLANGGRIVYDLNTGNPTVVNSITPGQITLGGETFTCAPDYFDRGQGSDAYKLFLYYTSGGGVYSVAKWGGGSTRETLATLESGAPNRAYFQLGWSINCRYIAGAIASGERDHAYDIAVWDVLVGRRVGTFSDSSADVQITWDTAEQHVLIENSDGATLWSPETGTRVKITDQTKAPPANCRYNDYCHFASFDHVYWDAGRRQMLGVPVDSPNAVVAYDIDSGKEAARYTVDGATEPVDFMTSGDSRLLLAYANGRMVLWNRASGTSISFQLELKGAYRGDLRSSASISTDDHFLAIGDDGTVYVYDLTTLREDGGPVHTYTENGYYFRRAAFINGDTLKAISEDERYGWYSDRRLNVVTGEMIGFAEEVDIKVEAQTAQQYNAMPGTSGRGAEADASQPQCPIAARYDKQARQIQVHDEATHTQRVIASDVNTVNILLLSPDCKTVYADVYDLNTSLPYEETGVDSASISSQTPKHWFFWDVATGQQISSMENPRDWGFWEHNGVHWSPDGNRALIDAGHYYLIDPAERIIVPVIFQDTDRGSLPDFTDTYWDQERGLVLVAGFGEVFAIDMRTGRERVRFPAREDQRGGCYFDPYSGCGMGISDDGKWVFVYGTDTIGVWNIDTLAHATLPVANPGRNGGGVSIGPDGRYLIVSRSAVRVWDLTNLSADMAERTPIATYNVGGANAVLSIDFVDNETIEVVTRTDDSTVTTRYAVATGAVVS